MTGPVFLLVACICFALFTVAIAQMVRCEHNDNSLEVWSCEAN